jgi:hypothetical protein
MVIDQGSADSFGEAIEYGLGIRERRHYNKHIPNHGYSP